MGVVGRWNMAAALALVASGTCAQVVNIEGRRFLNDSIPWTGVADFRSNLTENTQRSFSFGLSGALQHVRGRHRFFFVNDLAVSRVGNNAFLNTGFQHVRYNRAVSARWTAEAFAQTQYNKPLKLDLRGTLGAGPRFRVVNEEAFRMHVGTSVMFEYERITNGMDFGQLRSSTYLAGTLRFSSMVSLISVVYYQPRLFLVEDHRVMVESGLLLTLAKYYTFESRINLLKDSDQPPGIPMLTYSWTNRFGIRF